jgi:hypothetical protein
MPVNLTNQWLWWEWLNTPLNYLLSAERLKFENWAIAIPSSIQSYLFYAIPCYSMLCYPHMHLPLVSTSEENLQIANFHHLIIFTLQLRMYLVDVTTAAEAEAKLWSADDFYCDWELAVSRKFTQIHTHTDISYYPDQTPSLSQTSITTTHYHIHHRYHHHIHHYFAVLHITTPPTDSDSMMKDEVIPMAAQD